MTALDDVLVQADGFVPKARYTTAAFADLELDRLWPRVWQIACRTRRSRAPGDFVEYTIGDETIVIVCGTDGALHAFFNACLHRGRRLVDGSGTCADGTIRCPYHGWCYGLDGRVVAVPDRDDFADLARRPRAARACTSTPGAGSCS